MTEPADLAAWQVGQVRSSLELLAAGPQKQAEHLERLGTVPLVDELALEFDDARPLVPGLIDLGLMPPAMEPAVEEIESRLRDMAGDRSMWSTAALTSTRWEELRALANDALQLLGSTNLGS